MLDSWIMRASRTASITGRLARIRMSNWHHRLWTFQEGGLARNLTSKYMDGAQSTYTYATDVRRMAFPQKYSSNEVCLERVALFSYFESLYDQLKVKDLSRSLLDRFLYVIHACRDRSTSRPRDEAICYATMLGLDAAEMLDTTSADERMRYLLVKIGRFPKNILLESAPRLPGLGWAPRTFLSRNRWPFWSYTYNDEIPAEVSADGSLRVTYSGMRLGMVGSHLRNLASESVLFMSKDDPSLSYVLSRRDNIDCDETEEFYLISKDPMLVSPCRVALGALDREQEQGCLRIRCVGAARLWLSDAEDREALVNGWLPFLQKQELRTGEVWWGGNEIGPFEGEILREEQKWCVL